MTNNDLNRQNFIAEAHRLRRHHFQQTASTYDSRYGQMEQTHFDCVNYFLATVAPGQEILDAACGTGKYFQMIIDSGHSVFGIDDSAEMLAKARKRWPDVPTQKMALQQLQHAFNLHQRFAGLMCVDAMEWVLRDDWAIVLSGFSTVLKPKSPAYINIELPGEYEKAALEGNAPDGAMLGEILVHEWYNHFPSRQEVLNWLSDVGFSVTAERIGNGYLHLLIQSP
jgi:SAM-dependent methyltransferase